MRRLQETITIIKDIKIFIFILILSVGLHQIFRPLSDGPHWLDNINIIVMVSMLFLIGWRIGKLQSNPKFQAFIFGISIWFICSGTALVLGILIDGTNGDISLLASSLGYIFSIIIFSPLFGLITMIGAIAGKKIRN